jgi:hypothetical protein
MLGLAPMDEGRDAEFNADPDIRDDPREDDASEELGMHRCAAKVAWLDGALESV